MNSILQAAAVLAAVGVLIVALLRGGTRKPAPQPVKRMAAYDPPRCECCGSAVAVRSAYDMALCQECDETLVGLIRAGREQAKREAMREHMEAVGR